MSTKIYIKCERKKTQFGFRNSMGIRDTLFYMQVLVQRCMDINRDVCVAYIDYEMAFDRVKH